MDGFPINIVDLAIVVVVVVSGVFAFVRGFVHEALAIGAWIGAAIVTVAGLPLALPYARELISVQIIADVVAGVAIFLVVLVALSILTHLLARRVRESSLGALDRSLGFVFGLLRGAVIICLAWIALSWLLPRAEHPIWIQEARALPLVERGATMLISLVPEDLMPEVPERTETGETLEKLQNFEELITPKAGQAGTAEGAGGEEAGPDDGSGYNQLERKELQRLIDSSQ